jgi:hypothetical protein
MFLCIVIQDKKFNHKPVRLWWSNSKDAPADGHKAFQRIIYFNDEKTN